MLVRKIKLIKLLKETKLAVIRAIFHPLKMPLENGQDGGGLVFH